MRLWWLLLALLATSLAVKANKNDEDGAVSEEDEEVEEEKEKFTPSQFVRPEVKTGTLHLFEFFAERTVLGPKWVKSTAKKEGVDDGIAKYNGEWEISTGTADVAIVDDFGLVAKSKARHHAIASRLATPFRFDAGKPLVVQYEVKYEEGQECGGGYVKLLTEGAEKELANFQDRTDYTVMFGPDKCGANGKVHLIFKFKNPKNGTISEHAAPSDGAKSHLWDDHNTHLYTLIVNPDNSYSVSVDESTLSSGNLLKDLVPAIEPPKEIPDPDDKKPADWDERETIEDETAEKPDDWDEDAPKEVVDEKAVKPDDWLEDEEAYVPDPTAKKPDDWDVEMDGEWEAPLIENEACKGRSGCGKWKPPTIPNPNYKGKWRRPQIPNPAYKGVWKARLVDNKNYYEPRGFADLQSISAVGFELWTMSANIIFDNILITDSSTAAAEAAALTYRIRVAEAKRLAQALGKEGNFWDAFIPDKDKPWLWAVYVLVILLPTIFIGVYCFGNKSTPVDSTKKTDEVVPDDEEEVPNLVGDEEEEEAAEEQQTEEAEEVKDEEEEQSSRHSSKSRSRSRSTSRSPSRKAAPLDEHSTEPSTSTVTKRRQRRQD